MGAVNTKKTASPERKSQVDDSIFFKKLQCYQTLMSMGFEESQSFAASQIHADVDNAIEYLTKQLPNKNVTSSTVASSADIDYKTKYDQLQSKYNKLQKEFNQQRMINEQLRIENDKYRNKLNNLLTQSIEKSKEMDDEKYDKNNHNIDDKNMHKNQEQKNDAVSKWFESNLNVIKCDGICKSCYSINRIGEILSEYKKDNNLINKYFENVDKIKYSSESLYNDYHHILFKHHDELEAIIKYLNNYYIKCNTLKDCQALSRN
eukprot:327775_1